MNDKTFIFGVENDCVDITILDSASKIIVPWHDSTMERFDLDKDGITDFEIHSNHAISPGGINYQESFIKIVNSNFQISIIEMSDTLHRCMRVANYTLIAYTFYNNYSTYSCSGDGIDTTYSPNIFNCPSIHYTGESLTLNETWSSEDNLTLSYSDQSNHGWYLPYSTSYLIVRGNWNNQYMKYLLFKKIYNGKNCYGWQD